MRVQLRDLNTLKKRVGVYGEAGWQNKFSVATVERETACSRVEDTLCSCNRSVRGKEHGKHESLGTGGVCRFPASICSSGSGGACLSAHQTNLPAEWAMIWCDSLCTVANGGLLQ
jgi:hypothetical protein